MQRRKRVEWVGFEQLNSPSSAALLDSNKEQPRKLAEVVGI
jgi:hypothetical protein